MKPELKSGGAWILLAKLISGFGVCGLLISACGIGNSRTSVPSRLPGIRPPEITYMTPTSAEAGSGPIELRIEFNAASYQKLFVRWNAETLKFQYCGPRCVIATVPKQMLAAPQTASVRLWADSYSNAMPFTVSRRP